MKKLLFLLYFLPAVCFAQTDSVKVKPHDIFCRLFAVPGRLFTKSYFHADFGPTNGTKYIPETVSTMINAELAKLNNEIDALDYLAEQGWELFDTNSQRDEPLIYLLRKKVAQ